MRTGIVDCKGLARSQIDSGVGLKIVWSTSDECVNPPANAGGTDLIIIGAWRLPRGVQHIQDLIALAVPNPRRKARREFHHVQRNCLRTGCAANLSPKAQSAFIQSLA